MEQGKLRTTHWRHAAVALAYAIGFMALREVSFSHWVLFAGFRLSALLLVPYRYWPALFLGELAPLAYTGVMHADRYGWLWSCLYTVPPIGVAMPVVRWCREQLRLFVSGGAVNMAVFLFCTLMVSVLWTLIDLGIVATAQLPHGYPELQFGVLAARWFIGNFLGVLTLAPLVLFVREGVRSSHWRLSWRSTLSNRLFLETASILLPALAILVWLASASAQEPLRQAARMAMFLPVVWLSLRHGWHGAAVGGTFASIAVVLTMPARYDTSTLQAQVFIAFAITTMLLLGERIALLNQREIRERDDARLALALAHRNMLLGEMQLRQTSTALEHVREAVQATYGQMLERLRHMLPAPDEREYRLRAAVTQQQLFRLADSLHPVLWRDEGLSVALRQGSIARALEDAGIHYWCELRDHGLNELSSALQIALYRVVCDAVAYVSSQPGVGSVVVRLRPGSGRGQRWVALRVESTRDVILPSSAPPREDLLLRLPASGLGLDAIRDRVSLFKGHWRARKTMQGERISLILHDGPESGRE